MITSLLSPSEITRHNRIAEHVFNRYGINVEDTQRISDNTALIEVNPDFLVDVLNIYCHYEKAQIHLFTKYSVPTIVDYLTRSHRYYMEKILPEIGQSITILLRNYEEGHPLLEILYKFYFNYKADLATHFSEEEDLLFLYAKRLYKAVHFNEDIPFFVDFLAQYSIKDFMDSHDDTVEDLSEVRNILSQYVPPATNRSAFRVLLEKLNNFEEDLNAHAFIEDKVLVPKLQQLEERIKIKIKG